MRFDINETLLRHIAIGGGAASQLRKKADNKLIGLIEELFGARSDIRRLAKAQEVSDTILRTYDFGDIMKLRKIVATQELLRLIGYEKQKDHTSHTVYLYLLGIWVFDHIPAVQEAVTSRCEIKDKDKEKVCDWFLFQWLFASLLHDIGYAFFDLSGNTVDDRTAIDGIYSWDWLLQLFGSDQFIQRRLSETEFDCLRTIYDNWWASYKNEMPEGTASYNKGDEQNVITRLSHAPWLGDFREVWKNKNIFEVWSSIGMPGDLQAYATTVAQTGYRSKTDERCVDHAVASGLLLFQYSSYWYSLVIKLRSNPALFSKMMGTYDYNPNNMLDIAKACGAIAYHNVLRPVGNGGTILDRVTLESHPVLYLAILCDELQRWDRYPAGKKYLIGFESYANTSLEGGDIELASSGTDTRTIIFKVEYSKQSDVVDDIKNTLLSKLGKSYASIVTIERSN